MRDEALSHVADDTVEFALDGLSLNFVGGWNYEILAIKVRKALSGTILPQNLDPARLSNKEVRDKLAELSQAARSLDNGISKLHFLADHRLRETSFKEDGFANFIGFIFSQNSQYFRFRRIVPELSFLADFLEVTCQGIEEQSHKWEDSEKKRLRILRAETLIPIFEDAYGKRATVNNASRTDYWRNPTKFMIFYQSMMGLAFAEKATPNLVEVLKTARKNYEERCC